MFQLNQFCGVSLSRIIQNWPTITISRQISPQTTFVFRSNITRTNTAEKRVLNAGHEKCISSSRSFSVFKKKQDKDFCKFSIESGTEKISLHPHDTSSSFRVSHEIRDQSLSSAFATSRTSLCKSAVYAFHAVTYNQNHFERSSSSSSSLSCLLLKILSLPN